MSNASFISRVCPYTVKGNPVIEEGSDVKSFRQYVVMDTDSDGYITRKVKYIGPDFRTVVIGNNHSIPKGKDGQYASKEDWAIMTAPIDGSSREEELERVRREAVEEYKKSLLRTDTVQTQK